MKLIVFGATGGTGRSLVHQAVTAGHRVTVFARDPKHLVDLPVRIITGNVLDETAVTEAVRDQAVVLSGLGTRPWNHVDICSGGTRIITKAMVTTGVRRIIVLSSQGVGDSTLGLVGNVLATVALRKAFADKKIMEDELAEGDRDWIVVRPGLLTNGRPRGSWRTAVDDSLHGGKIARADVAAFMLQQLTSDEFLRKRPVLVY